MNTNHSSLIRGLNIAITVLAALSLLSCVVGLVAIEANKTYIYDAVANEYYDSMSDVYNDYWDDFYDDEDWYDYFDDDYWYDHKPGHHHTGVAVYPAHVAPVAYPDYPSGSIYGVQDAWAAMDIVLGLVNGMLIWEIVVSLVSLLFGILGLVNAGKPGKLQQLMGIGIAGAVVSFLGGHIILVVLFIISAVMANKDKTALLNANLATAAPVTPPVAVPVAPAPAPQQPSQDANPNDIPPAQS